MAAIARAARSQRSGEDGSADGKAPMAWMSTVIVGAQRCRLRDRERPHFS
jgi:hypothetical protein